MPGTKRCICHSTNPGKDLDSFLSQVNEVFTQTDVHDFAGFWFPSEFRFPENMVVPKDAYFSNSVFLGKTNLVNALFKGTVTFAETIFEGDVLIHEARFLRPALFSSCLFLRDVEISVLQSESCSFERARFKGSLRFERNAQRRNKLGTISFRQVVFDEPAKISFRQVFLPDIQFDGCDTSRVSIIGIERWDVNLWQEDEMLGENVTTQDRILALFKKVYNSIRSYFGRAVGKFQYGVSFRVGDERVVDAHFRLGDEFVFRDRIAPLTDPELRQAKVHELCECYQKLQRNMLEIKNYTTAGRFHVREMEVRRRHRGPIARAVSLVSMYKWLSDYGESVWRPLAWIGVLFITIPLIIMLWMGPTVYYWTGNLLDAPEAIYGWLRAFAINLLEVTSSREPGTANHWDLSVYWQLLFIFERLFSILLVSLTIVAVRRRFKRY